MDRNLDFVVALAAPYAEKYTSAYREITLRRFPEHAPALRELFDLTERLHRFFEQPARRPDPTFRAGLKAKLLERYEDTLAQEGESSKEALPFGLTPEWYSPPSRRRLAAFGVGSAVAMAGVGVIAAYWRRRSVPPAA